MSFEPRCAAVQPPTDGSPGWQYKQCPNAASSRARLRRIDGQPTSDVPACEHHNSDSYLFQPDVGGGPEATPQA